MIFTNKNQLWELRQEVCLGSLFTKDYNNSFGVSERNACDFFDGYLEYLYELAEEDGEVVMDNFDCIEKWDTKDNLWEYYCLFDDNPLWGPEDGGKTTYWYWDEYDDPQPYENRDKFMEGLLWNIAIAEDYNEDVPPTNKVVELFNKDEACTEQRINGAWFFKTKLPPQQFIEQNI